ncbi:MAG: 2Fe-2S iron-sulfur cluster-binding protein [Acidimicrobiales bacterium]
MPVELIVDGRPVVVENEAANLLEVLREQCGIASVKDGCAPQGQCGCCTVLVDGQARVSCVTPVRRISGRSITTVDGLPEEERAAWADALTATGGSQCGFCTPGIICRMSAMRADEVAVSDPKFGNGLAAHLCRCTGWQSIAEAYDGYGKRRELDPWRAARRAELEGGVPQQVGPHVALGEGGFSTDTIPPDAWFAVPTVDDEWVVRSSLREAREASGKVQGRRTTVASEPPIDVPECPDGEWHLTLQTSWVEPAPLETETVWCVPGGEPSSLVANGGAFGAKSGRNLGDIARHHSDLIGHPVAVVLSREDSVRLGAKRPPLAAGVTADGHGIVHVARTSGIVDAIRSRANRLEIVEVDVAGPPTSAAIRGAGWVEAAILMSALLSPDHEDRVASPDGAGAGASLEEDGIHVTVNAGTPLDDTVLRSYCVGAAHMAYSWVTSESLAVDSDGSVHDLTIRSFDIVRASDTPPIHVEIIDSDAEPINGSDAVFAAVAAATWRARGYSPVWPSG